MSTEAPKKSLVKKLAEVMGLVERVAKSGRNNFHNYDYATEADIVSSVRGGLAERGVILVPSIQKIEWTEKAGPKPSKIATITVLFTFMDGESGEKVEFIGMGQGEDASDKAIYKAMTGAEKYALLKTFLIPTGDDPEKDAAPQQQGNRAAPPSNNHAAEVKRQLKSGAPVVGETTLEKEAREKREAAAKAKDDESTQAMLQLSILQRELGWTGEKIASVIRGATGKADRKAVTLADVQKVRAAIDVMIAAESRAQAPPPH